MLRRTAPVAIGLALAMSFAGDPLLSQGRRGGGGAPVPPAVRDATDQAVTGTGILSGVIVAEGSGAPVRRARVSLTAPELRGMRTTATDDNGRFVFLALPAGRYSLTASKAGFVDITYGAKRAGRQGTPIQLAEGQHIDRLSVSMPRGGVLTGVVVDEHGEPAPGIPVRALRYVMRTGERALMQAGQDQTDDRGMYRIYQLQPGDYLVATVPRNVTAAGDVRQAMLTELSSLMQSGQQVTAPRGGGAGGPFEFTVMAPAMPGGIDDRISLLQQQIASLDDGPTAYAPVYYPGTTSSASALTITLDAGEERGGVDFRLQLVPTTRVTGIVTSPGGALPQGTQVALVPDRRRGGGLSVPGLGNTVTRVDPEGRFTLHGVTPGDYLLQARALIRDAAPQRGRGGGPPGGITQVLWASAEVSVAGQTLPDIVLDLQGGMTVSGRVDFQGSSLTTNAPATVRVSLMPRGAQLFETGGAPLMATTDESGRFSIAGVPPGRYGLSATTLQMGGRGAQSSGASTASWSLKSAVANGQDLLDFPIDIGPNQSLSNVAVTYTDKVQELSGTIQDTFGGPTADFTIIVFPADTRYWLPQARRIAATRPATDGRFVFRGLPPGDYRLTAVTDVEPGEWYDPALLSRLGTASIPISLAEGERKVQDIRLAGQ